MLAQALIAGTEALPYLFRVFCASFEWGRVCIQELFEH